MARDNMETIQSIVDADGRYHREAYVFTLEAFNYTVERRRNVATPRQHIDGRELCDGIREYAEQCFGYLTKTVFSKWGVTSTRDFGEIVFSMIEVDLLAKNTEDRKEDFADAYSFDEVFEKSLIFDEH